MRNVISSDRTLKWHDPTMIHEPTVAMKQNPYLLFSHLEKKQENRSDRNTMLLDFGYIV